MAHFNSNHNLHPSTFATGSNCPPWQTTLPIDMDDFEAFDAMLDHWVETGVLNPITGHVPVPGYNGKCYDYRLFSSCLTCGLQVSRFEPLKTHTRPKVGRSSPVDAGWGNKPGLSRSIVQIAKFASPTQRCWKHLLSGQPPVAVKTVSALHL